MKIRTATHGDVPAMMELERRAVTAAHWTEADYQRLFSGERVALVMEEDEVRGFIVARSVGDEWEIENIAIAGEARRRGLGTRLVGELLARARAEGASGVFLEVRESNLAARQLYTKWAFEEYGRRPGYYSDPTEDAVLYRFCFPQALANSVEGVGGL
jgi:ribosomal-protein-alanine N-acetyltransferase